MVWMPCYSNESHDLNTSHDYVYLVLSRYACQVMEVKVNFCRHFLAGRTGAVAVRKCMELVMCQCLNHGALELSIQPLL